MMVVRPGRKRGYHKERRLSKYGSCTYRLTWLDRREFRKSCFMNYSDSLADLIKSMLNYDSNPGLWQRYVIKDGRKIIKTAAVFTPAR